MVSPEALETSGTGSTTVENDIVPETNEGIIIEFPRINPMDLTRDEWLNLPSDEAKKGVLVSLRKKDYKPGYVEKMNQLFPEGYSGSLSDIENKVFSVMNKIISGNEDINSSHTEVLREYLHDISVDEAISALTGEKENKKSGNFWYTRQEIGGYELNRLIVYEIEEQVKDELYRDTVRLHSLQDISVSLRAKGIPMLEKDQAELDILREEHEEREEAIRKHWQLEREKGYKNLGLNK